MTVNSYDLGIYLYNVINSDDRRNFDEIEKCVEIFKLHKDEIAYSIVYDSFQMEGIKKGLTTEELDIIFKRFDSSYNLF